MCKVSEIGQTSAFAKRGNHLIESDQKTKKEMQQPRAKLYRAAYAYRDLRRNRPRSVSRRDSFFTTVPDILSRTGKKTFPTNYFPVFAPSRARPPLGSYKFVCTFARPATIIAIGFAPISVCQSDLILFALPKPPNGS